MYIAVDSVLNSVVLDLIPVLLVIISVALDLIPVKWKPMYEVFSGVFSMRLEKIFTKYRQTFHSFCECREFIFFLLIADFVSISATAYLKSTANLISNLLLQNQPATEVAFRNCQLNVNFSNSIVIISDPNSR